VHGVTAQVFLSLSSRLPCVHAILAQRRGADPTDRARGDRRFASVAVAALLIQIVFGAIQRHLALGLMLHIVAAIAVASLTISGGAPCGSVGNSYPAAAASEARGPHGGARDVDPAGAWFLRVDRSRDGDGRSLALEWKVFATTLHQGMGAVLLASTVSSDSLLSRWLTPKA
jgi:hypothetical protein